MKFCCFAVVQSLNHVRLLVTPWTAAYQSLLPFIISWSLLKFISIELVMLSNQSQPLLPHSSPAFNLLQYQSLFQWVSFSSGGQNIRASASASILSMNIQNWFPLGLISLISLRSKWLSGVFSSTTVWKHQFFGTRPSFMVQLSYLYVTTGKTMALAIWIFVGKVKSLIFFFLI